MSFEEDNQQDIKQEVSTEQTINQENNVSQENHIQNDISKDFHVENNPQVTQEIEQSQNISQNYNESILENPQSQSLSEISNKEKQPDLFNESIHREDWIEGEENNIAPRHNPNKDKDNEL